MKNKYEWKHIVCVVFWISTTSSETIESFQIFAYAVVILWSFEIKYESDFLFGCFRLNKCFLLSLKWFFVFKQKNKKNVEFAHKNAQITHQNMYVYTYLMATKFQRNVAHVTVVVKIYIKSLI